MANDKVQLFEDQPIRTAWVEDEEEWYFSVVDVVQALTESADGRKYWNKLKQRLKEEGSQLVTNCHQLKMRSPKNGKRYNTDVANTEQLLRIMNLNKKHNIFNDHDTVLSITNASSAPKRAIKNASKLVIRY